MQDRATEAEQQAWRDLMRYVKKYIRFGTVQIEIRDYVPQRIVAAKETVKLGAGEVP